MLRSFRVFGMVCWRQDRPGALVQKERGIKMKKTDHENAANTKAAPQLISRDGTFLFPTASEQQRYLRGLDPLRCAPGRGGRTIEKSEAASLPMAEEMRFLK
jgi:hypothetical protein